MRRLRDGLIFVGLAVLVAASGHAWGSLARGAAVGAAAVPLDLGLRWFVFLRPGRRDRVFLRPTVRRFSRALTAIVFATAALAFLLEPQTPSSANDPFVAAFAAAVAAGLATSVVGPEAAAHLLRRAGVTTRTWTAASIAERRQDSPADLPLLLAEINAHFREGNPSYALGPMREALAHSALVGWNRGEVAATLGWTLLHHYPDDPVPSEALACAGEAQRWAPDHETTRKLQAYVHLHEGRPKEALRLVRRALKAKPAPSCEAQLLCLRAGAHALSGDLPRASADREQALRLSPACDLLPWLDERLTTTAVLPPRP
jgi:tetratricopeptide (TPR) repeat protein